MTLSHMVYPFMLLLWGARRSPMLLQRMLHLEIIAWHQYQYEVRGLVSLWQPILIPSIFHVNVPSIGISIDMDV